MKYAVVTGSTKGIGKAIALRLLAEGYYVIANYRSDDESAEEFAKEADEYKERWTILKKELSSYEAVQEFVAEIKEITDHMDCIVLNCGATDRSPFKEITKESWEYVLNTNVSVPFYLIQGLDDMLAEGGRIVFIGSLLGIQPHASSLGYGVTKAAVHQMAKDLVKVFAPRKITVNAIAPGFTDTPWQINKPAEQRARIESKIALGRFGMPDEIAQLCMEVIHNGYINGAVISIDGGYSFR